MLRTFGTRLRPHTAWDTRCGGLQPDETGWCPVEVTLRTVGRRLLLRPSTRLTLRINGILARAQRLTGVRVHLPVFPSNHGHQELSVPNSAELARFMQYWPGPTATRALYDGSMLVRGE